MYIAFCIIEANTAVELLYTVTTVSDGVALKPKLKKKKKEEKEEKKKEAGALENLGDALSINAEKYTLHSVLHICEN